MPTCLNICSVVEKVQHWAQDVLLLLLLLALVAQPTKLRPKRARCVGGCKRAAACDAQRPLQLLWADARGRQVGRHLLLQRGPILLLLVHLQGHSGSGML